MSPDAPFVLDSTGYHVPTKRRYIGRLRELATEDSERGRRYRAKFLGSPLPTRKVPLRTFAEAEACVYLDGARFGCPSRSLPCRLKGKTTPNGCVNCPSFRSGDGGRGSV